jgi:ATP-dependent Clp protease, protease subunit
MSIPYVIEKKPGGNETAYDLYSRLLKDRIVFVKGKFDHDMADSVVAQLLYLESQDSSDDIYMYVDSPGGHISAMFAIYDVMNYIKPDVVTVGMGICASAGSFILASGAKGKRSALPNTEIMIHELSSGFSGKFGDLRVDYEHSEKLYEKMAKMYADITNQPINRIKKDMKRDFYMNPEEAVGYGLIDKIYSSRTK